MATQQDARGSLLIMSNALYAAGCGVPARLSDPGGTGQNAGVVAATATAVTLRGCFSDPPVRATVTAAVAVAAVPSALGVAVDTVANFAVGDQVYLYSDDRWAYGTVTAVAAGPPAQLTVTVTGHRRQRRPGDPRGRQPDLSGRAHDLLARGWDAAAHALSGR